MALAALELPDSERTADRVDAAIHAVETGHTTEARVSRAQLLYDSFSYFMSELVDDAQHPLMVDEHQEEWCDLFQFSMLLCLLAPRDHGKTWTDIAYLLWRVWRHNRDPLTGETYEDLREGKFEAVLFSETLPQAEIFFETFQSLLLANAGMFSDVLPRSRRPGVATGDVWSKRRVRLRNLASVIIRGFRTSTRGLHPDLIVLDDVLNDENTLTQYQRDKVWRYFVGTLIPMNAKQYIVIGTAFHADDLLHRLKPNPKKPVVLTVRSKRARFRWVKYRSVNWETGQVLWAHRHNLTALKGQQSLDALLFAREMQNDPIDDSSSMFPRTLTGIAIAKGADFTLVPLPWDIDSVIAMADAEVVVPGQPAMPVNFTPQYMKDVGEFVILGNDLAAGAEASSDYTVIKVAAFNRWTGQMRLLWTFRQQGLSFKAQVMVLRMACAAFRVDVGVVESNGFQKWLHAETMKHAETAGVLTGHTTGQEKTNLEQGVPSVRLALEHELWTVPSGDEESAALALIWQNEMQAYGWKDGKLMGIGEHDDEVMTWWFLDRARKLVLEFVPEVAEPDVIYAEDLGIEPVKIGKDY